jgi:hypothetical protein
MLVDVGLGNIFFFWLLYQEKSTKQILNKMQRQLMRLRRTFPSHISGFIFKIRKELVQLNCKNKNKNFPLPKDKGPEWALYQRKHKNGQQAYKRGAQCH